MKTKPKVKLIHVEKNKITTNNESENAQKITNSETSLDINEINTFTRVKIA